MLTFLFIVYLVIQRGTITKSSPLVAPENRLADGDSEEERALAAVSVGDMNNFLLNNKLAQGVQEFIVPEIVKNEDQVKKTDSTETAKAIAKSVGDTLNPLIAAGLSLIPGIGPIIGGIFSSLWTVASMFLGEEVKDPMVEALEDMQNEINTLKNSMVEMDKKLRKDMSKAIEMEIGHLIQAIVDGETDRNKYVCDHYSVLSKLLVNNLKQNKNLTESNRVEMIATLHDCDDFLKDTMVSFEKYPFVRSLWMASLINIMTRVAFLTEVINYGLYLKLNEDTLKIFSYELKHDINIQFQLFQTFIIKTTPEDSFNENWKIKDVELDNCKLQTELIYMDRTLYPYGVPEKIMVPYSNAHATFNSSKDLEYQHLQLFLTDEKKDFNGILNCIMGPTIFPEIVDQREIVFQITWVPNKMYQVRLLCYTYEYDLSMWIPVQQMEKQDLTIDFGKSLENPSYHVHWYPATLTTIYFKRKGNVYVNEGTPADFYIMELGAFTFNSNGNAKEVDGKVIIADRGSAFNSVYLLGLEFIVLPVGK